MVLESGPIYDSLSTPFSSTAQILVEAGLQIDPLQRTSASRLFGLNAVFQYRNQQVAPQMRSRLAGVSVLSLDIILATIPVMAVLRSIDLTANMQRRCSSCFRRHRI